MFTALRLSFVATLAALAACTPAKVSERPPDGELWIAPGQLDHGGARVEAAREADLPRVVVAGGRVAFDDARVAHVLSPVSGRLTRVLARLGETLAKGSPLASIVSPDVGSALSDLVKARADITAAEHDYRRQTKLFGEGAASQRDYESAEDTFQRAKAEEARALQRMRLLKSGKIDTVTQEYSLPSPIAGRLIARMVSPGMEVQGQYSGGAASELFTVGSTESVWLYADVAEADLPDVQLGAAVAARVLAYPDRVFHGKVEWLSTTLDPQLRTARVRCSLPNADGLLKPEMFASVLIDRPSQRRLAIPRAAVVRINDHSFVYVPGGTRPDGKEIFKRRQVEVPDRGGPIVRGPAIPSEVFLSLEPRAGADLVAVTGLTAGEKVLVDSQGPAKESSQEVSVTREQLRGGNLAVEKVDEREVPDLVTIGGRLTFDDLRVSHVFSPVNGRITQVLAAPGDHVQKGTPLATIASADLGSAFSDMLKAQADLVAAEHAVKRERDLFADHAAAQRDLEAAEDVAGQAQAEYDRAEQKTRLLRAGAVDGVSQQFLLRSPIEGEITARLASPGLEVQGQYGGGGNMVELFTVGETDPLWLLGDVYEMDLPYVKVGDEVDLRVSSLPGRSFRGTVDWISDVLDPVMRTAKVRCVLQNPDHALRPEMYEMASISVPTHKALSVPRDALLRLGDETLVFVAAGRREDGQLTFRTQRVVANDQLPGDRVPVLAGLKLGEDVAAKGAIFLLGLLQG